MEGVPTSKLVHFCAVWFVDGGEAVGSNLGWGTVCPDSDCSWFSSPLELLLTHYFIAFMSRKNARHFTETEKEEA
jgi:hypothetical protein